MRLDLVVNSMCYSAWRHGEITVNGGGTQARPLLHVHDAADAFIKVMAAESDLVCGEVINIGSPSMNCSIEEIASGLRKRFSDRQQDRKSTRLNSSQVRIS